MFYFIEFLRAACENNMQKLSCTYIHWRNTVDILTLNCGSSSVKFQVYDWDNKEVLANGVVERIGQEISSIEQHAKGRETFKKEQKCPSHKEAIQLIIDALTDKT